MPPARIASASSFFNFRSPWLNLASCPGMVRVRRFATSFAHALPADRQGRPPVRRWPGPAAQPTDGRAGSPTAEGEPHAAGPRHEGPDLPVRRHTRPDTRTVRLGPRGSSTRAPEDASVARHESTWSTGSPVRAQSRRSVHGRSPRKVKAAPRRSSGSVEAIGRVVRWTNRRGDGSVATTAE